jgi:hypothetical protein
LLDYNHAVEAFRQSLPDPFLPSGDGKLPSALPLSDSVLEMAYARITEVEAELSKLPAKAALSK